MSTNVLHAPLLFAGPLGKRHRAACDQATTEQRKERRNRKFADIVEAAEVWVALGEENQEDQEGERQNKSTQNDPNHRPVRIFQSQPVACLSGLDKRVQISVRPLSKTTMRGHFSFPAKRRAQFCDEQLPFPVRWAARKRHDSPDGCRQPESSATRDGFSTPLECRDCLRDTVRGQPNLAPDILQLEKRQTIDGGERLRRTVFLTDGQIENLPDFVVLVPALFAHVGATILRYDRCPAATVDRAIGALSGPQSTFKDYMCDQKRFHIAFPRLPNPESSARALSRAKGCSESARS